MELSEQKRNPEPEGNLININVSGQQFLITADTLKKYPETKLGKLVIERPTVKGYFFESDVDTFKEVLKFYQKGKLHCPKNICFSDFCENLEYWKVDLSYLSECCSEDSKDEQELEKQFQFFNNKFKMTDKNAQCCREWRYKVWSFLTDPYGSDKTWKIGAKVWMVIYFLITCVSGMTLAVATQPFSTSDTSSLFSNSSPLHGQDISAEELRELSDVQTACLYFSEWRKAAFRSRVQVILSISFVVFYAVEIWIRFSFCPNKCLFWKSLNALDMIISICECISVGYLTYVESNLQTLEGQVGGDTLCEVAITVERIFIIIGQLRFLRLLGYATVYR